MVLADFIGRHAGETAWLFGKGPSLTTFDFKTAGPLRVAINDVIGHVPDCKYGFANDGVRAWADLYQPGQVLFQPARCLHEYDSTAPDAVRCDVVTYDDTYDDERMQLPVAELAQLLAIRRGTLGSALQVLKIMGVRSIYMVGIDGGGEHAEGYDWKTRLRHDHAKDYNAIRNAAIDAAWIMGIALRFHGRNNDMEPNGKVFVKITRNCFAAAQPYCQGEVASFNPKVAADLISARCAEPFTPAESAPAPEPPAPVIERAEAPMSARESATVKTTKSRVKSK